ncbi:DUF58 domain-containing protein [Paraneptunicella aestuarii]|uniref:DUF58 domain-containing protein n=1 Tax=Paraneptunicella aestuarii TaxID=2831148 RepID=UPI0038CD57E8|nr:DUF58 domain-containing protein [Paraneptunicella aestuarii]
MLDAQQWLQTHFSDGCNLNIKELLQYRSKTALIDLNPRRTIQAKLAGSYVTKTKGRGMEFDEARHYQPGDDIRAIDWRVTARTGKTHTKLYREERERPVFILADFSSSMYFGTQLLFKSVQTAHLASLIAWSAAKRGDRVGGLLFNEHEHHEFKPLTRQKAVLALLSGIVDMHQAQKKEPQKAPHAIHQTNPGYFSDACARLRRLARPGSLVFLISDFMHLDDIATQHISRIARHCELVAYQVTDPFEHELPKVSVPHNVSLTDGFNSQTITLGEEKTAQQYASAHAQMSDYIRTSLQKCMVQHMEISAALPLEQQLNGQTRRTGRS